MPGQHLTDLSDSTTTRRTVVRTGAKLAYAAPLVAASLGLGTKAQAADVVISGVGCADCAALTTFCGEGVCSELTGQCEIRPFDGAIDLCCGDSGERCIDGICQFSPCNPGFRVVGGICIPLSFDECHHDGCACGFQNVQGICVPLPSCFF